MHCLKAEHSAYVRACPGAVRSLRGVASGRRWRNKSAGEKRSEPLPGIIPRAPTAAVSGPDSQLQTREETTSRCTPGTP